jgi:hypothetical protein
MAKIKVAGVKYTVSKSDVKAYKRGEVGVISNLQQQHHAQRLSLAPPDPNAPPTPFPPVEVNISKKNRTIVLPALDDVPGLPELFKPFRPFYKAIGLRALIR